MTKEEYENYKKALKASNEIDELLYNSALDITGALQAVFTTCQVTCTTVLDIVATAHKDDIERAREYILGMADILTQSIKNYKPQSE